MLLRRGTRQANDPCWFVVGLNRFIVCANHFIGLQGQGWVFEKDSQLNKRTYSQGLRAKLFQRNFTSNKVCSIIRPSFNSLNNNVACVSASPAAHLTGAEIPYKELTIVRWVSCFASWNDTEIRTQLQIAYAVQDNIFAVLHRNREETLQIIDMIETEMTL